MFPSNQRVDIAVNEPEVVDNPVDNLVDTSVDMYTDTYADTPLDHANPSGSEDEEGVCGEDAIVLAVADQEYEEKAEEQEQQEVQEERAEEREVQISGVEEDEAQPDLVRDDEPSFHRELPEPPEQLIASGREPLIVKLPVLLASKEIEFEIFQEIECLCPISSIHCIDWRINHVSGKTLLPSNVLFIKGTLTVDMGYASATESGSLKSIKMYIPWWTTTELDWIRRPVMPVKLRKEYDFRPDEPDGAVSSHIEQMETYADDIQYALRKSHIIDARQTERSLQDHIIVLQAAVTLSIDLLQPQYVRLPDQN